MVEPNGAANPENQRVSPRVLIVDDDIDIVNLLALSLTADGYTVQTAYDGLEALDKIAETHPDVIILDLMMPKVDGSVVCLSVKHTQATRHIKIIILTAKIQTKDKIDELCKLEADLYMTKPFEPEELSQNIKDLLAAPSETSEDTPSSYFRGQN